MSATQTHSTNVLKKDRAIRRVTPSEYTLAMLEFTEECLANAKETHPPRILELLGMNITMNCKTVFQAHPSELIFQNFTPAQTYKLPLVLVNKDKVSWQMKLELQDSQYFSVVGPEEARSKVAPGMSATFMVVFTPKENKDYHHRLVCVTEREQFEIPIIAIGPRAILDFRDELELPECPVKASTQRTQLVRNIGNVKSMFELLTQKPFSVTPSSGTLEVDECMQVTVDFNPMTTGVHRQDLLLQYHTGEDVCISLYGVCEEINIHLEPESVLLKRTYISLSNVHKVTLTNNSEIPLQYNWTTWASQQEEDLCLMRESSLLQQKEGETEQLDPTVIHHLPMRVRALQKHRGQAAQDNLLVLSDNCITIEPAEGEIWPNNTAIFYIVFKPKEAKLYQHTIYCDVTGRESRLPLTIEGEGIGPKLQLDYKLWDIKSVFISDKDRYEVLVSNRGLIDAPFRLSRPNTTFGKCFSFSPEDGVIPSGACQIVEVTFHSCILGSFSEDLLLTVTGQPQPLTLTFRGCVISPTLHFNVSELSFGDVAFGFPRTTICTLFNKSTVPVTLTLHVQGDGLGSPSVTSVRQCSELIRTNWQGSAAKDRRVRPVEFTVTPAVCSVPAMSDITIKVTLCSNTVRRYSLALVVDVEGVGERIITLPINARCVVPEIVVETPVLEIQRCFLNHPYERRVRLTNKSTLPACYGLLDQEYGGNPSLSFGSPIARGVIAPNSSEELPVILRAQAVGHLHHTLRIAVFGSLQPPLEVVFYFIGQGPVVHIKSQQLDFGRIPVLTDITRALHLSNQSPIPAHFTARMSHRKSLWRVEPSEGEVPPEGQLELRVVAHLKDTLFFQDKLEVSIQDGQTHTVALSATGTGTTIVSDRPFAPSLDLGTHLSHETCQYHFKLTNHGQRTQLMHWRTDGLLASTKTHRGEISFLPPIFAARKSNIPNRGSLTSSRSDKPVFSISPSRVELFPGCSVDMVLTGTSDSPKVVQERLVCNGVLGQQSRERIMSVDVTCRFVAPVLSISSKLLNFHIERVHGKHLVPLYEKLVLKNVSPLSLSMKLSVVQPFSLCESRGAFTSSTTKSKVLGKGKQAELWVCFNPSYWKDRVSRAVDEYLNVHYEGHPQRDTVVLHAEVHFPNLHFSSTTVDFGCVLNCTETQRELTITNCSPLPVVYRWAFLVEQRHCVIRETEVTELSLEADVEQKNAVNNAFSAALSPNSGAQEQNTLRACSACMEEVFDVLPLSGQLQPGEQQLVMFYFYSHTNVSRDVVAQCQVELGPIYEIKLRGETSEVCYSLDSTTINFGQQLFDHVGEAKVILRNTGRVGFQFSIETLQKEEEEAPKNGKQQPDAECQDVRPGQPLVIPTVGYIDTHAEQCLRVLYLPGVPGVFEKQLQLQVAHLPMQDITLTGEGVFPRISLNLPRNLSEECDSDVVQQAKAALEADRVKKEFMNRSNTGGGAATEDTCPLTDEELLHMEVESILVKENALAVTSSLLEIRDSQDSPRKWHKLSKFLLPEYVLDFGYVIPGKALSHTVNVTNTGSVAVSLRANCKPLSGTGFSTEFPSVKNLSCGETQTFTVKFDSQGATLQKGNISVVMLIQVTGGPVVQVRLRAVLTVPNIFVSTDTLQFDSVQRGMCQIKKIQLLNHASVPCNWSIAEEVKLFIKVNKFLPLYQRKKLLQDQRPPVVFKIVPCLGLLSPGEMINVQVKFSPTESCAYNRKLVFRVAEGIQQVYITAQGKGEEPQPELSPSGQELSPSGQELRPTLPFSTEVEAAVTVKILAPFCVESDSQCLEEEKREQIATDEVEENRCMQPLSCLNKAKSIWLKKISAVQKNSENVNEVH